MTYHTSINWVNIKSIGYKLYPVETNFLTWEKWFRTLTIQPYNWIDNRSLDGKAALQHVYVRKGGSSPPDCLFNWTDDMHTPFIMPRQPTPARHLKIVKRCESAHIPAVQRVSSVQLVAPTHLLFSGSYSKPSQKIENNYYLVLSTGNTKNAGLRK